MPRQSLKKGAALGRSARPAPCRLRAVPRAVRQWPQAISSKLSTSFSLMLHTLSKSDTHQRCWAGASAWLSLGWLPRGGVCCSDGRSAQWAALGTMPPCPGRSALCTGRCLEHPGMACCSAGRRAFGRCARRFLVLAQRVAALLAMFCVEPRSQPTQLCTPAVQGLDGGVSERLPGGPLVPSHGAFEPE